MPMTRKRRWIGYLLLVIVTAITGIAYSNHCGDPQPCGGCPNPWPSKWCQRERYRDGKGGFYCITPVTYQNHSINRMVDAAANNWNYPPEGPINGLVLYYDGNDCPCHDIDYWNTYSSESWWGITVVPTDGNCYLRGQGAIYFNTRTLPGDDFNQLMNATHETGHAIGLDHTCDCGSIMDACGRCGPPQPANCDGQAIANKYPFSCP